MRRLLFIEPRQPASPTAVVDHFTRRMCAAFRRAKAGDLFYCGVHECCCGAESTATDYTLPNGQVTNSLCVHYLAHHRTEVTPWHLNAVEALAYGELEPTAEELQGPEWVQAQFRALGLRQPPPSPAPVADALNRWRLMVAAQRRPPLQLRPIPAWPISNPTHQAIDYTCLRCGRYFPVQVSYSEWQTRLNQERTDECLYCGQRVGKGGVWCASCGATFELSFPHWHVHCDLAIGDCPKCGARFESDCIC